MSFFLFKGKKRRRKKRTHQCKKRPLRCRQPWPAAPPRESRSGKPVRRPKPVVGSAVFSSVGLGIPLWRVRFTWSFLALLLCSRAFAAGKKELSSLFKIRTERKESFLLMR